MASAAVSASIPQRYHHAGAAVQGVGNCGMRPRQLGGRRCLARDREHSPQCISNPDEASKHGHNQRPRDRVARQRRFAPTKKLKWPINLSALFITLREQSSIRTLISRDRSNPVWKLHFKNATSAYSFALMG